MRPITPLLFAFLALTVCATPQERAPEFSSTATAEANTLAALARIVATPAIPQDGRAAEPRSATKKFPRHAKLLRRRR